MNRSGFRLTGALVLVLVSVFYGMVNREQLHRLLRPPQAVAAAPVPVRQPMRIESAADIDSARADLIALLWGDTVLPSGLPSSVDRDHRDTLFSAIPGVNRVERLVVEMAFGLRSVAYHFVPDEPNGRVVIYHAGHGQELSGAKLFIEALARAGHAVVGLEMPLEGSNRDSNRARAAGGSVALERHADFGLLRPDRGHAMRYFIEPVVIALNYIEQEYGYSDVAMAGLSGGGWTTTIAAALDRRIRLSFPVAGSHPRYLRVTQADLGDWEQQVPAFYDLAGYRDLYVMGAHGPGRKQIQMLNIYDPCCFDGLEWQTYVDEVAGKVSRLGPGEFHLLADDTHQRHAISSVAMGRILLKLAQ